MDQVGGRVAELQLALASRDDIVDFAPEPIAAEDVRSWTEALLRRAGRALDQLAQRRSDLTDNDRPLADALQSYRDGLPARLRELLPESIDALKIRHHGDFPLRPILTPTDALSILHLDATPPRRIH